MKNKDVNKLMKEVELVQEWIAKLKSLGYEIDEKTGEFIAGILYGSKKT